MPACPLLGTNRFVKFCSDRGLQINRERRVRLERLGLFGPVFRVRTPQSEAAPFCIPLKETTASPKDGRTIQCTFPRTMRCLRKG